MSKILFVATIHKHFVAFHIPYIKWLKEQGHQVHCVANGDDVVVPYVDRQINFDVQRSPFKIENLRAYFQLKRLIEFENYDLVHCHTAMGAVMARLASRKNRKKGITKVLYTAHGFHFFKGSPRKYWLMYYPMERYLSKYTDGIVTINNEDYELIQKSCFKHKKSYLIPGIGVDIERLKIVDYDGDKKSLRKKYGYAESDFIMIYIAEHIERKNHKFLIDTMVDIVKKKSNVKLLFAGKGRLKEQNIRYISQLGLQDNIFVLGFRKDIGSLIAISDIGVSASKQEGLGLNLAEEMFFGLPIIASQDRGHKEMIVSGENGYFFAQNNKEEFISYVMELCNNENKRRDMGEKAKKSIQKFSLENALNAMIKIYNEYV